MQKQKGIGKYVTVAQLNYFLLQVRHMITLLWSLFGQPRGALEKCLMRLNQSHTSQKSDIFWDL